MNTAQQSWEEYRAATMPKNAPPVQVAETRQAFYAGCLATFQLMVAYSEYDEDTAAQMLDTLSEEVADFFESMSTGAYAGKANPRA